MADKFKNKYRIASARLQSWDYGANAAYFITICTKNHVRFFGDVVQSPCTDDSVNTSKSEHVKETPESGFSTDVVLSDIGELARKFWFEIPEHFSFVKLGAFVVMPDHIHGVLIIDKRADDKETPKLGVSTTETTTKTNAMGKWKPGVLGVIVNQYKRIITINARKLYPKFAWQTRFYDTIIRDDRAYSNISRYIVDNPRKWIDNH